ncbi:MAG: hypothetical protein ABEJ71_01230, partial [Halodesulfurarchaeum sp.]
GRHMTRVREWIGFCIGLGLTSMALSSGFIWAYQGKPVRVFSAAFLAWVGYLGAHYAIDGEFIDSPDEVNEEHGDGTLPDGLRAKVGLVAGAGVLVLGMIVGVYFIRAEHHLGTNIGGVLFLGGYVISHYAGTGNLL